MALDGNRTKRYIENRIAEDEYESTKKLVNSSKQNDTRTKTKRETTKLAKKEVEQRALADVENRCRLAYSKAGRVRNIMRAT